MTMNQAPIHHVATYWYPGTSSPMITIGTGRKLRYRNSQAPMRAGRLSSAALVMRPPAFATQRDPADRAEERQREDDGRPESLRFVRVHGRMPDRVQRREVARDDRDGDEPHHGDSG